MKIQPTGDRVIVRRAPVVEQTASGLVIPSKAQEASTIAEVVSVGPGLPNQPMQVKVGEKVLISKHAGAPLEFGDDKLTILREQDILGVVEA